MRFDVKDKRILVWGIFKVIWYLSVVGLLTYSFELWSSPLSILGLLFLFHKITLFLKLQLTSILRQAKDPLSYGKWAVVTGATSGIGEAFVYELARRGINVLMVSRSLSKLEEVKANVEKQNDCGGKGKEEGGAEGEDAFIDFMVNDFSVTQKQDAFYQKLKAKVDDLHQNGGGLGILVNNVGVSNELPDLHHNVNRKLCDDMVNINIKATLQMTETVLPLMIERQKGAIINISSASGNHPTPFLALYSATKAFVTQFSLTLAYEYESQGIDVLVCTPYYVVSNMFKRREPTLIAPSPSTISAGCLRCLGKYKQCFPYYFHRVMDVLFSGESPGRLVPIMQRNRDRLLAKQREKQQQNQSQSQNDHPKVKTG